MCECGSRRNWSRSALHGNVGALLCIRPQCRSRASTGWALNRPMRRPTGEPPLRLSCSARRSAAQAVEGREKVAGRERQQVRQVVLALHPQHGSARSHVSGERHLRELHQRIAQGAVSLSVTPPEGRQALIWSANRIGTVRCQTMQTGARSLASERQVAREHLAGKPV